MTTTDRAAYTDGLRRIADLLDAHPDVPLPYLGHGGGLSPELPMLDIYVHEMPWADEPPARDRIAAIARALADGGRTVHKHVDDRPDDPGYSVWATFGGIALRARADRDTVCEARQVGTEAVTKTVRDPDALAAVPTVEVTEEVPVYEWECRPLLASEPVASEAVAS